MIIGIFGHKYFFCVNKNYYKQKKGLGMGLPFTMANIFLCNYETTYLNEGPLEFKPVFFPNDI